MRFPNDARNKLFWIFEAIKGGKIIRHIRDLELVFEGTDRRATRKELDVRLHAVLKHCIETVPYYSNMGDEARIASFPVIDKNKIRENLKVFLSDKFRAKDLVPAVTSGSTGTPFKVFHDRNKKARNTADTIYFARKGGYRLGNKLYYFKIWSDLNRKNSWTQWMQHIVPVDVLNLQANAHEVLVELEKNKKSVSFIGYVSAFETLCKALEKKGTRGSAIQVNSVITMSEALNEYTKSAMLEYFRCPALSRYSNIENGIIAQQTLDDHENFMVNVASYYVEILDIKKDEPLPHGQLGRIVVTDLFNYGMPLIRYDTGDLGISREIIVGGRTRLVLERIEGRKLDQIFNTKGELISSYIVYRNMWKYTEIRQYQLIQRSLKEYVFKVCTDGPFQRETELVKEFKSYLGKDAIFTIAYVNEIPLLDSGKRRKIVNEMNSLV